MLSRAGLLTRSLVRSNVRYHSHGGIPGENLPFDLHNRYKLTAYFTIFMATGIGAPWFVVWLQQHKK